MAVSGAWLSGEIAKTRALRAWTSGKAARKIETQSSLVSLPLLPFIIERAQPKPPFALFVGIWQCLFQCTSRSVPELTTPQLTSAGVGVRSLFYTKWFWVFVSGGVVLNFFRGLFFAIVLSFLAFSSACDCSTALIVNVVWFTLSFPYVLLIICNVNQMINWSSLFFIILKLWNCSIGQTYRLPLILNKTVFLKYSCGWN